MATGGTLTWCGGSSARVWTANDGPLQVGKRGNSTSIRVSKCCHTTAANLRCEYQQEEFSIHISDKQVAKCL